MKRYTSINTALLLTLAVLNCVQAFQPPNIVYFYADDMGWGTISANQRIAKANGVDTSEIEKLIMPNIDKLTDGGINFTHAYGNTVCSPARSSQQTGFHQGHTWADRNDPSDDKAIRTQDPTLGKTLAAAGYRNGMYGKWGYGATRDPLNPKIVNPQTLPIAHGYHDCVVELHHIRAHTFLQPTLWYSHVAADSTVTMDTTLRDNQEVFPGVDLYADNYYTAGAIKFIRTEANGPSPFFAQLSFQIPHSPFGDITTIPGWFDAYANTDTSTWGQQEKQYAAMITLMDQRIGEVLDALRDPNNDGDQSDSIIKNTLIIFSSDNGGGSYAPVKFFKGNGHLSNYKGSVYEGGIRDPLVFYWEGVIKPGQSTDYKTCVTDIFPTFCELAGIASPVGLDGSSIAPLLTNQGYLRKRPYFCYEGNDRKGLQWSVIRGQFKLSKETKTGKLHLYDLDKDESEQNNLADSPEFKTHISEMQEIALAENLEEPDSYANVFPTWIGGNEADITAANSWRETGKWDFDRKWPQSSVPEANWNARVVNTKSIKQTAYLKDSIQILGFEVAGNATNKSPMELTLHRNVELTGRNEIRIAPYGVLKLDQSTLTSTRRVDIFKHGTLEGHGRINSDLYNAGTIQSQRIHVTGSFHQTSTASLQLLLSEGTPLAVQGQAQLNGTLRCELPTARTFPKGQSLALITASSIKGRFNNGNDNISVNSQRFKIQYNTGSVNLIKQ